MLTVLFWNVARRPCEKFVANLARGHSVDILVLAECVDPTAVGVALGASGGTKLLAHHPTRTLCRVAVFSRFQPTEFAEVESFGRYCVHRLSGPNRLELLIVSAHALSGRNASLLEQEEELRAIRTRIAKIEDDPAHSHTRTLLIGDLNADPFDRRVTAAVGLHAVADRRIAEKQSRRVARQSYRFFFNPMWSFAGKQHPEPQGTYFYRKGKPDDRFWHTFDQVLLRPSLLPYFRDGDVSILRDDGAGTSFQTADGRPDKKVASDHFPILLKLAYPGV